MWRKKAAALWQARVLLVSALLFILTVPAALVIEWVWLAGTLILGSGVLVCGYLPLYWNAFSLVILPDRVVIHSGAFVRKTVLLPFTDLIFTTIRSSPVERSLRLCRVRLYGRGRTLHLLCLPSETAQRLEQLGTGGFS